MYRRSLRNFHRGHSVLDRLAHLLESAHLDLPHALARDAELFGQFIERDWAIDQSARLKDAPLAVVQHSEGLAQRLAAIVELLAFDEPRFLAGALID
jgi:hypothetical protein